MFKSIRKRVNSVLPDIENLYLTSNSGPSTPTTPIREPNHPSPKNNNRSPITSNKLTGTPAPGAINLSAGCDILEYNESIWEEIHSVNEQNASKAQCVDLVIESLTNRLNKKLVDLSDINVSLEAIPNIVKTVQNCSNIMYDVNKKCTDVERGLVELENLMEVLQLQEKQLDRKLEIAMYKERRLSNLEKVRRDLATQHAQNVRQTENQMSVVQRERQAVFQDAFQNDMNCYKALGSIPKIETKSESQPTLKLEEVELDNDDTDKNELNNFLNSN